MAIDRDTARRVAHLARIEVGENDLDDVARELSTIIDLMDQLATVDVEGVEPMFSVTPMAAHWREDVVNDGGRREDILANAPETVDGFFAVPKVVE